MPRTPSDESEHRRQRASGPDVTRELVLEAIASYLYVVRDPGALNVRYPAVLRVIVHVPRPAEHFGMITRREVAPKGVGQWSPAAVRRTWQERGVLSRHWHAPLGPADYALGAEVAQRAHELASSLDATLMVSSTDVSIRWARTAASVEVSFYDPRQVAR